MKTLLPLTMFLMIACGGAAKPAPQAPTTQPPPPTALAATCDAQQAMISRDADLRAAPWNLAQHLAKNFSDGRVSWLMKDASYQNFVIKTGATNWGRCNETGCYVFVAPAAVIHGAVERSMTAGHHDPAALGKALGLPSTNFEGPLRMMTLDINKEATCARLPVDSDPGVWKCQTPEDQDCFKFGGYTSGGIPELMVINAPIDKTTIEDVQ